MEENVQTPVLSEPAVHDFNSSSNFSLNSKVYIILGVMLVLGIFSGFLISKNKSGVGSAITQGGTVAIQKGAVFGSDDTKTFKDQAEGIVKTGGADGEGTHHLVRPGGDSQNVYLTSSIVDLSKFLDKKVKVWGQTQKAKVAGWLMDVGRVEVLQ